jgi:hypothetical protein
MINSVGGFYQVGSQLFLNKVMAILEAERTNQFPYFIFHDEEYSQFNWIIEPTETLDQLYAERAWELRNQYDYLVLHFSGGSDSTNILETFIKNKIPLDELLLRGPWKSAQKEINNMSPGNMHAEIWFNSWPLAQHIKEVYYPNIKITTRDTTDYTINFFQNNSNWWENLNLSTFYPGSVWRADIDLVETTYLNLSESGKRVGHIIGIEKPTMYHQDGKYHVRFLDKYINWYLNPRISSTQVPCFLEPFYWSASSAKMIIKQAHALKNHINSNGLGPEFLQRRDRLGHEMLAKILYNRTLPLLWTAEKNERSVGQSMDQYFYRDRESVHVRNYMAGIEQLNQIIPKKWVHDGSVLNELVGIWSKSYTIGP